MEVDNTLQARWGFLPKSENGGDKQEELKPEDNNYRSEGQKQAGSLKSNYTITALQWLPTWRMLE